MSMYTAEQLEKRNNSKWTTVQAILGPLQFIAFIISFWLVVRYLSTGEGYMLTNISVIIKIALLWLITITGMIWEKEVYGHWFLAPQFFWEDVGNAIAMLMHNLYFLAVWLSWSNRAVMLLMLIAYISYLFNFGQFALKGWQASQERKQARLVEEIA